MPDLDGWAVEERLLKDLAPLEERYAPTVLDRVPADADILRQEICG